MVAILNETVGLETDGARVFETHLYRPDAPARPGLVILTEMWGITQSKLDMAADYARRGFCTIVPNFFWRCAESGALGDTGPERERAWERLRTLDFNVIADDLTKAVRWLRSHPGCSGKIGAIGFCMGGRLAVLAATRSGVDAAISLYALGIADHLDEVASLSGSTLQIHYGLADKFVPIAEIEAVGRAAAANPNVEIALYPGIGHGFFNPERATFSAHAVERAQQSIDRLLARLG
jgi:carboxymethylenebutenolidase